MPLEVFQAPATLREQLIEFQNRQQCYPLTELEQHKEELAGYVGVYLLYYRGQFPLYRDITYANQDHPLDRAVAVLLQQCSLLQI